VTRFLGRQSVLICQLIASLVLIVWLVYLANPRVLLETAKQIAPGAFVLSLIVLAAAHALSALRLQLVLRAMSVQVSLGMSLALTWLGLFTSNFLPSSIGGDAVVAAVLHRRQQKLGAILTGIILNRLANLCALVMLLPIVLVVDELAVLRPVAFKLLFWLVVALAVAITLVFVIAKLVHSTNKLVRVISGLLGRLYSLLQAAAAAKAMMIAALAISLLVILGGVSATAVLAQSQVPSTSYWSIVGIVLILQIVQLVPITFNGIGLQESAATFCLMQIGWPLHEAVALSLAVRLITIAISLPGLFPSIAFMRRPASTR